MAGQLFSALLILSALILCPIQVYAWTNGDLLIWMDAERGKAVEAIAQKFEDDLGLMVTIDDFGSVGMV